MASRNDSEEGEARPEPADIERSGIDSERLYFNRIARNRLLGREAEVALAKRIEDSEHLMLEALLSVPALREELVRARAELPPDEGEEAAEGAGRGRRGWTDQSNRELGTLLDTTIALLSRVTAARRRARGPR